MYLTDLSFIEEGTPDFTEDGLLNFSKMRMASWCRFYFENAMNWLDYFSNEKQVAHVIREIRHFQSTSYKIEHSTKVNSYLLDINNLVDDEDLYQMSLEIEPRQSRLGSISHQVGTCLLTHQLSTTTIGPGTVSASGNTTTSPTNQWFIKATCYSFQSVHECYSNYAWFLFVLFAIEYLTLFFSWLYNSITPYL